MKIYLAIKYFEDNQNINLIKKIKDSLKKVGFSVVVLVGESKKYTPKELMNEAFRLIDESNVVLVEFSEKGVGLGIEAGYVFAKKKPIVVIAKVGSEISETMRGIAKEVIFYEDVGVIGEKVRKSIV